MPTAVSATVDPGGTGDYTSCYSGNVDFWAAAGLTGSDLVSNDEVFTVTLQCTNGAADTGGNTNWTYTCDATRNITVIVDDNYRHSGTVPSSGNVYRTNITDNGWILNSISLVIDGVAFSHTTASNSKWGIYGGNYDGITIKRCVVKHVSGAHTGSSGIGAWSVSTGKTHRFENCIAYDYSNSACHGFEIGGGDGSGNIEIFGCTIENCTTGIELAAGSTPTTLKNILEWNCSTPYSGTWATASACAYSSGSDPGTGGVDLSTATAATIFNDLSGDDFSLAAGSSNPVIGMGVNLYASGVITDIVGKDQPSSNSFDIGAHRAVQTFYVDATAGNDSNNGVSTESPWQTISQVNDFTLNPGDTISFKKGETWREELTVPASGTSAASISFNAYGTGDDPIIKGCDVVSSWSGPDGNGEYFKSGGHPMNVFVLLEDGARITRGSEGSLNAGEWDFNITANTCFYLPSTGVPGDHTIETGARYTGITIDTKSYLSFSDLQVIGANYSRDPNAWGGGIEVNDSSNITFSSCFISQNYHHGIGMETCTDMTISDCEISYNQGSGIRFAQACADSTVSNCHVHHNTNLYSDGWVGVDMAGIEFAGDLSAISGMVVTGTEINHNGIGPATDGNYIDSGLAFFDAEGDVSFCNIHHNGAGGVYFSNPDQGNKSGDFCYNLIHHNNQNEEGYSCGGLRIEGGLTYEIALNVYNNVIAYNYSPDRDGPNNEEPAVLLNKCTGTVFKNNIVAYNTGNNYQFACTHTSADVTLDYNLYFGTGGYSSAGTVQFCRASAPGYTNYTIDQMVGGTSGFWSFDESQDAHSLVVDPGWTDGASADFTLTDSSLCIDAGVDVSLTADYIGTTVPQFTAPDIGAYESTVPYNPGITGILVFTGSSDKSKLLCDCESADNWRVLAGDSVKYYITYDDPARGKGCLYVGIQDQAPFVELDMHAPLGMTIGDLQWFSLWLGLDTAQNFRKIRVYFAGDGKLRSVGLADLEGSAFTFFSNRWQKGWNYKVFDIRDIAGFEHIILRCDWRAGYRGRFIKVDEMNAWERIDDAIEAARSPLTRSQMRAVYPRTKNIL